VGDILPWIVLAGDLRAFLSPGIQLGLGTTLVSDCARHPRLSAAHQHRRYRTIAYHLHSSPSPCFVCGWSCRILSGRVCHHCLRYDEQPLLMRRTGLGSTLKCNIDLIVMEALIRGLYPCLFLGRLFRCWAMASHCF
jgi:hypothetical protein